MIRLRGRDAGGRLLGEILPLDFGRLKILISSFYPPASTYRLGTIYTLVYIHICISDILNGCFTGLITITVLVILLERAGQPLNLFTIGGTSLISATAAVMTPIVPPRNAMSVLHFASIIFGPSIATVPNGSFPL